MPFSINQKLTELRIWASNKIAPKKAVQQPAHSSISRQDIYSLAKLIMQGNKLSSVVRSRTADRMNNWGALSARNDVKQLNRAYRVIESLHEDSTLRAINSSMTRDGLFGFDFEFSASTNNEDQKIRAKIVNELCKNVAAMIQGDQWSHSDRFLYEQDMPITLADTSYNLGMFANIPVHYAYDKKNIMNRIRPLTPFMWQINSDSSFQFPDPAKAYSKFDALTEQLEESYSGINLGWIYGNRTLDGRYAVPFAHNLAVEIETLNNIVDGLDEARKAGNPRTALFVEGQAGIGLTLTELQRLMDERPEEAMMRGDHLGPLANIFNQIIPGKGDLKTASANTGIFSEYGDVNLIRENVGIAWNTHLGLYFDSHKANRNTLDLLIRLRSQARKVWRMLLILSYIYPAFCRQNVAANIDSTGLVCEVHFDEEKTLEELIAEAQLAIQLRDAKLLSQFNAHSIACKAVSVDPKTDQQKMDEEAQSGQPAPPQTQPGAISTGTLQPQLTAEQLVKQSIPNVTKADLDRLGQNLMTSLANIEDIVSNKYFNN